MNDARRSAWPSKIAASAAMLVGIFLILGGWGHLEAVAPAQFEAGLDARGLWKILPGIILATAGLVNVLLAGKLWSGRRWAYLTGLAMSGLAFVYILYLLVTGVPGHPIGIFTIVVGAYLALTLWALAGQESGSSMRNA